MIYRVFVIIYCPYHEINCFCCTDFDCHFWQISFFFKISYVICDLELPLFRISKTDDGGDVSTRLRTIGDRAWLIDCLKGIDVLLLFCRKDEKWWDLSHCNDWWCRNDVPSEVGWRRNAHIESTRRQLQSTMDNAWPAAFKHVVCYAWFPPFHCRSPVAILPFRCAVPLYRCRSSIP